MYSNAYVFFSNLYQRKHGLWIRQPSYSPDFATINNMKLDTLFNFPGPQ